MPQLKTTVDRYAALDYQSAAPDGLQTITANE